MIQKIPKASSMFPTPVSWIRLNPGKFQTDTSASLWLFCDPLLQVLPHHFNCFLNETNETEVRGFLPSFAKPVLRGVHMKFHTRHP